MEESTLLWFKREMSKFFILMKDVSNYFDRPHYTLISVLIQNLSFVPINYDIEQEEGKIHRVLNILVNLKKCYDNDYVVNMTLEQVKDLLLATKHMD